MKAGGQRTFRRYRIIGSSDHETTRTRGPWGKSNMYEESAAVPMIMAGPDVPRRCAASQ